jgi:diguanylate cyclase (GGDEF)-like protein
VKMEILNGNTPDFLSGIEAFPRSDTSITIDDLLEMFLEIGLKILNAESGSIMLLNRDHGELLIKKAKGLSQKVIKASRRKAGEGISGYVLNTRQPLLINNSFDLQSIDVSLGRPDIKSSMIVPLGDSERCMGVASFNTLDNLSAFNDQNTDFISRLACRTSQIIDSLETYDNKSIEIDRIAMVFETAHRGSAPQQLQKTLMNVIETALDLSDSNRAGILVEGDHPENEDLHFFMGKNILQEKLEYALSRVYQNNIITLGRLKKPIIVNNLDLDDNFGEKVLQKEKINSFVILPLISNDDLVGRLIICSDRANVFSATKLRFLYLLANQAAAAILNAKLYADLEQIAFTDSLTQVNNRKYLLQRLEEEMKRARRLSQPMAIIMIDIDNFKMINDTMGHKAGDKVLRDVAGLLRKNLREIDLIGRYGGEEFIIILPDTSEEMAMAIGERTRLSVEAYSARALKDMDRNLTISGGLAMFPLHASDSDTLIEVSDQALYSAKRKGRNRILSYSRDINFIN